MMIYCSNCGKNISNDSKFCRYCGVPQHGPEAAVYRAQAETIGKVALANPAKKTVVDVPDLIAKRHLAPRVIWSFFFNYLSNTAILIPLFLLAMFLEPLIVGTVFAGYFVLNMLVAIIVFRHFFFLIDENGLQKEYGVFHKQKVSIPFDQIQNVNIGSTIVERMFGLASVDIETAGSSVAVDKAVIGGSKSKAEAHLPGVTLADAKIIHDLLLQKAAEAN